MITLYQAYCIDQNANPAPMNMARWERLEAASRTRSAAANIPMVFDAPALFLPTDGTDKYIKARPSVANLTTDTAAILAIGKALETLNLRQIAVAPRGGMGRGAGAVPGGAAIADATTNPNWSCFWCGATGHSLMDCPGPAPNQAANLARDEMLASRDKRATPLAKAERNAGKQVRRLAIANSAAASSAQVSDDEDDDDGSEDTELAEATYAAIQSLFQQNGK
jgi:hypothetical protein